MSEIRNGAPRYRSPGTRARSIEPGTCYLSDGVRLIDYVLVYDLDKTEEDDNSVYEEAIEVSYNVFTPLIIRFRMA